MIIQNNQQKRYQGIHIEQQRKQKNEQQIIQLMKLKIQIEKWFDSSSKCSSKVRLEQNKQNIQ
ncbi:unnamed protein product [Paramecium sonneborni]|uniref:Uncharacterized protein n=1 Tax=Paramecium sonneborni TaxID=65129 RepID=A0A8S1R3V4_9CILI|nr:unnamed protein product [Paramecium sonneborni]